MRTFGSHRASFRYHPQFGFFFRNNIRLWQISQHDFGALHLIATNSVGARCTREPAARTPGAVRVLFIGDSLTAGDLVSNRERFTEVLEEMIPGVESHNYALPGSAHDQQLLIHRAFAPIIDPDVLVLCPAISVLGRNLLTNRLHYDAASGGAIRVPRPYFTLDGNGALVSHNLPVPKPSLRIVSDPRFPMAKATIGRRVKELIKSKILKQQPPYLFRLYDDPQGAAYRLGHALLTTILRESRARVKLLAAQPDQNYVTRADATNHRTFFASVAESAGVPWIDVAEFFKGLPAEDIQRSFFPHDRHYTRAGHRVIARGFADVLRPLLKG